MDARIVEEEPQSVLPRTDVLLDTLTGLPAIVKDTERANPHLPGKIFTDVEELERLGRIRPEKFGSTWTEILFVFSICMSQIITEFLVSGFVVVLPTVTKALHIPDSSSTWPANAFSLVIACFLLVFGRLADIYGGKIVYICGMAWLVVWTIIAGFAQNELMLDFSRALMGLGPAMFLPSGVMLLGSVYRPGPRKNLIFGIYGAAAPFGFFVGIFFAGLSAQYISWRYYFFFGAIFTFVSLVIAILSIPSDKEERKGMAVKMDYQGSFFIVCGLILVVFAVTDSASATGGWRSARVLAPFFIGLALLCGAWYVEGYVAYMPLLPFDIFTGNGMFSIVVIVMVFTYGGLGILLLYTTLYMENILDASPMLVVAWYLPMALGGCVIALGGGFILHKFSGTVLMAVGGTAWVISPLLFAVMTDHASYWTFVFPSMICATVGIDISFTITNIFITTSLPARQQGLAGALINSILQLSIAVFLGFADIISSEIRLKSGEKKAYKAVFWFGTGIAAVALLIMLAFVRLDSAKSDKTADEKERDSRVTSQERSQKA